MSDQDVQQLPSAAEFMKTQPGGSLPSAAEFMKTQAPTSGAGRSGPPPSGPVSDVARANAETLEQAKRMPPVPMDRLAPHELRGYTDEERRQRGNFHNPRTGKWSTVGGDIEDKPILDSPIVGARSIRAGVQQVAQPGLREKAAGANKIIGGGFKALEPLIVGTGLTAPLATMTTVGTAMGVGMGTEKGLKAAKVPDEYAELGGNIAAIMAGGKASEGLRGVFGGRGVEKVKVPGAPPETRQASPEMQAEAEKLRAENAKPKAKAQPPPGARIIEDKAQPTPYAETQKPEVAKTLTEGAIRKMPDGSTQVLKAVPIEHIEGDPGNTITEETVRKYQKEGAAVHPELRTNPEGGFIIEEGHHRILADYRNGKREVLAWTPEESKSATPPPLPGAPPESRTAEEGGARKPNPSVTMGSGLGALDPLLEKAGEKLDKYLKTSWEEMRAEYEKRNVGKKAEEAKPETTDEERGLGETAKRILTGTRDEWEVGVNQMGRRVKEVMPDPKDEQALIMLRQLRGRPEIAQMYDGTHPDFKGMSSEQRAKVDKALAVTRPWYERAVKTQTPAMLAADKMYTSIAMDTLKEGGDIGNLPGSRFTNAEYVPVMTVPIEEAVVPETRPGGIGKLMGGRAGKHFAGAARRDYLTYAHAAMDGEVPRTGSIVDLFNIRAEQFATSRATHLFEDHLADTKQGGYYNSAEDAPEGYVPFAAHTAEFRKTIDTSKPGEKGIKFQQQLHTKPYIAEAMRPITDPDFMAALPKWRKMQNGQQWLKMVNVSMSVFHPIRISMRAAFTLGPKGMWDALQPGLGTDEKFMSVERLAAARGMKTPAQGGAIKAILSMLPGRVPTGLDVVNKAPIANAVKATFEKTNHFTFDYLTRRYKVWFFGMQDAAWIAKHPKATPEELVAAEQSIAKFTNAQFGGLHWENLGINKLTVDVMRMFQFAPDWFVSKMLTLKYATEGTAESGGTPKGALNKTASLGKAAAHQAASAVGARKLMSDSWEGAPAGNLSRQYWAAKITMGLIASQIVSRMYSGSNSDKPTQVYLGKDRFGNKKYTNMFFADADENVIRLIDNTHKHGLLEGAYRTLASQDSNFFRAYSHLSENRDEQGRQITNPKLNPVANTLRSTRQIVKDIGPAPISGVSEYDVFFGPEAKKYSKDEALLALAGQRVIHEPPPKKPTKADFKARYSTLKQAVTGDPYFVKHKLKPGQPPDSR
jgi:hypothetical protein